MAKKKKTDLNSKEHTVIEINEPVKIEWRQNWIRIFKIRKKKKTGSIVKSKAKEDKLESKRLAKEAKSLYKKQKKEKKISKSVRQTELEENLNPTNIKLDSKNVSKETRKKIRVKKPKDENQKFDFKQATREFPVKMIKEVNKIKWSGAENLTKKYITVIIFMAVFALIFFFIDWGLQALFTLMKVI